VAFRFLGIPIRVQGVFWLTTVLFAFSWSEPALIASGVLVMFVAVLVHELGHAVAARAFGLDPEISLHSFGGTTSYQGGRLGRGQNIVTTLAGPGAGFLLGALTLGVEMLAPPGSHLFQGILRQMLFCTFGWGILNLFPVLPLDGGLVLRDVLGPTRGRLTLILSALFGLAACGLALATRQIFLVLLFGMSTVQSAQGAWSYGAIEEERIKRGELARETLDRARAALEAGRLREALSRAAEVLLLSLDPAQRDEARRIAAAVAIEQGEGAQALEALGSIERATAADTVMQAQALDTLGERDTAFAILEQAAKYDPSGPALEPLLRGLMATGRAEKAWDVARENLRQGAPSALRWVAGELRAAGQGAEADQIDGALAARPATSS
jgi:Zn-dependent protease